MIRNLMITAALFILLMIGSIPGPQTLGIVLVDSGVKGPLHCNLQNYKIIYPLSTPRRRNGTKTPGGGIPSGVRISQIRGRITAGA